MLGLLRASCLEICFFSLLKLIKIIKQIQLSEGTCLADFIPCGRLCIYFLFLLGWIMLIFVSWADIQKIDFYA